MEEVKERQKRRWRIGSGGGVGGGGGGADKETPKCRAALSRVRHGREI